MGRLFIVPVLLAIPAEGILVFAFVAGYLWLGGVIPGLALLVAAALLMAAPWIGDLVLDITYEKKRIDAKAMIAWWARFRYLQSDPPEVQVRFLGIPYRRRLRKQPAKAEKKKPEEEKAAPDMKRWALSNLPDVIRTALAALQAANEMVWGTRTLSATANAPAQIDVVDQLASGLVGHRILGLLDVEVKPEGDRRLRFVYRIPLIQVAFVGLYMLLQGRPLKLLRSLRKAQKRAQETRREIRVVRAGREEQGEEQEAEVPQRRAA